MPVPDRFTVKELVPGSLLEMCNAPLRLNKSPAVKVTVKVVLEPTATTLAGGVVRVKSALFVPSMVTPETVKGNWPLFLSVKVLTTGVLTGLLPKSTLPLPLINLVPAGCSTAMLGAPITSLKVVAMRSSSTL